MSNIEFDQEQYSQTTSSGQKPSKMAAALIALGLVKDEKGANFLLIGLIAVLCVIFFLSLSSGSEEIEFVPVDDPSLELSI